MSNPFKKILKNAKESTSPHEDKRLEKSEVKTRVCPQCKAPRPSDTNLTTCDFCGFKFMDIDVEIKVDLKEE